MVKKPKKKDTTLDEILLSTESVNEIGVEQARSLSKAESYEKGVESIWGIVAKPDQGQGTTPAKADRAIEKITGGTETVPGTENVPDKDRRGTETVPGTKNVPGTESVPGTEKGGTESVPGTEKGGTETVPGTEKSGTESVPGTQIVPGTESVPGTETVPEAYNQLINRFSEIDRIYVIKRILALNVPHSARCLLLQMLTTMSDTREEISLSALSREVNTRKATLIEALKSLEMEEIIRVQRRITGIVIDLGPFLGGTETVPGSPRMYVCMNNIFNKQTYKQTIGGTETVPPPNSIRHQVVENNVEEILVAMDLLGIIKTTKGKTSISRKALKLIFSGAESDDEKVALIALARKTAVQAKKNPQAYWIALVEQKDRDELTHEELQETRDFMKLCERFRYKSFESPSLDELKKMAASLLKMTSSFKNRSSLVDYLQMKADELQDRLSIYKNTLTVDH